MPPQIDTLRLAIAYISLLREVLHSELEPVVYIEQSLRGELRTPGSLQWNTSDLTARLAWINWDNLGIALARNSFIGGGGGMPNGAPPMGMEECPLMGVGGGMFTGAESILTALIFDFITNF